jgi:hypothetical protein
VLQQPPSDYVAESTVPLRQQVRTLFGFIDSVCVRLRRVQAMDEGISPGCPATSSLRSRSASFDTKITAPAHVLAPDVYVRLWSVPVAVATGPFDAVTNR